MAEKFNFDWYQIPHTGVVDTTLGAGAQTRSAPMRISNFGALNIGNRMTQDYTRTTLDFKNKDDSSNWGAVVPAPLTQSAELNDNPYVLEGSIKKVRDDQFVRMGMSMGGYQASALVNIETMEVIKPAADVMDTKASSASGMLSGTATIKNYPTEGWSSFGGKYDKHVVYRGW